jgi:crossover junction endodeoxyribonuclease RuvC
MEHMRILGIDPGTGILGFGVIDVDKRQTTRLVEAGVIRTPVHQPDSERLETIYDELHQVIKATKPAVMSVEKLFFSKNVTTAMSVSQARGVVLLCGKQHKLELHEFTPNQIKLTITGQGRADKKQMQEMVRMLLGLKDIPKPDDAADALAAAICCAMHLQV